MRNLCILLIGLFGLSVNLQAQCVQGTCQTGSGTFIFSDGSQYSGDFVRGIPHGQGVWVYPNGDEVSGRFDNGLPIEEEAFSQKGKKVKNNQPTIITQPKDVGYQPNEPIGKWNFPVIDAELSQGNTYAVIIGISQYRDIALEKLQYADNDAYRFYSFLKSKLGGQIQDDHIRILTDEQATGANISEAIKSITKRTNAADRIVFYFSGHGLSDAFIPTESDGYTGLLYHDSIAELLSEAKAESKILFVDACNSDNPTPSPKSLMNDDLSIDHLSENGLMTFYSSQSGEISVESPYLKQGVFTHFLIRGLQGEANQDDNNHISMQELFDFVNIHVKSYTENVQSPYISGEPIFAGSK